MAGGLNTYAATVIAGGVLIEAALREREAGALAARSASRNASRSSASLAR